MSENAALCAAGSSNKEGYKPVLSEKGQEKRRDSEAVIINDIEQEAYWRKVIEAEKLRTEIHELVAIQSHVSCAKDLEQITVYRQQLEKTLKDFRTCQKVITPNVSIPSTKGSQVEDFVLGVPSDFTKEDWIKFGLTELARQEICLRESQTNADIKQVQSICRKLLTSLMWKSKNVENEKQRTRSASYSEDGVHT
ncbi:hypothetical protein MPER_03611, partial [Moniliophthora perniciosa FA553]